MATDHARLEELILCGELEEVFSLVTLEEIAEAWCRYQLRHQVHGAADDDPDWWAVQLVMDADSWSDEARIRSVLALIVERAQNDDVLGGWVRATGRISSRATTTTGSHRTLCRGVGSFQEGA
jgi:hypothetical protein